MTSKQHFYLLNLLKLLALYSIQTLHAWEFVFYTDEFLYPDEAPFYFHMHNFARYFSLGGQILVAIIYFLFGYTERSTKGLLRVVAFAFVGQFAIALAFKNEQGLMASLEWDIYSFLALTNLLIALIPFNSRSSLYIQLTCLLFLFISPSLYQNFFPDGLVGDVLTGRQSAKNSGSWAVFPWFFHALLFFSFGSWASKNMDKLRQFHSFEKVFWPLALLICVNFYNFYWKTPLGPSYYIFNFGQSAWTYWMNFLPFVFWMRISLISTVQEKAAQIKLLRWLSDLMWSKNIGLTYLLGIFYVGLGAEYDYVFRQDPGLFDLFYLSIIPVVEITARLLVWIVNKLKKPRNANASR